MIMKHFLMKYNGEVFPSGHCKGLCIMTETDRRAYERIVKTYFEERKDSFILICGGTDIVRMESEQEFWKCVKWVPITTEESYMLAQLELDSYGIYPTQEDFEAEVE